VERILSGPSEVLIDAGLADPLLPARSGRRQVVVVTQAAAERYAVEVAAATGADVYHLPDREAAKTWEAAGDLYRHMAKREMGRHDTIVGVGGGSVTDMAGFVAATWLRGIEVVHVPTTLLGAVDASIGGKTGINLDGKNLVGAFHHPTRVVVNLAWLEELPPALLLEGTTEALKAGLVGDPRLVDLYQEQGLAAPLEVVVPAAVRVKAAIVGEDFRESGVRAFLNLGHTVGHAIESATGMAHGLAVAVGLVAAAAVSEQRYGFDARWLADLLASLGLPTAVTGVSAEAVTEYLRRDKKRTAAGIRMVLLRAVADPVIDVVTDAELEHAMASVGIGSPNLS
jgi:3-dehydroquinate synthase